MPVQFNGLARQRNLTFRRPACIAAVTGQSTRRAATPGRAGNMAPKRIFTFQQKCSTTLDLTMVDRFDNGGVWIRPRLRARAVMCLVSSLHRARWRATCGVVPVRQWHSMNMPGLDTRPAGGAPERGRSWRVACVFSNARPQHACQHAATAALSVPGSNSTGHSRFAGSEWKSQSSG